MKKIYMLVVVSLGLTLSGCDFLGKIGGNDSDAEASNPDPVKGEYVGEEAPEEQSYVDAYVAALISDVSESGVSKYKLGAVAGSYLSDPEAYAYSTSIDLDEALGCGDEWQASITRIGADGEIATRNYDYFSPDYGKFYFNTDVYVAEIAITGRHPAEDGGKVLTAVANGLQDRGYSRKKGGEGLAVMGKGDAMVRCELTSDNDVIVITLSH